MDNQISNVVSEFKYQGIASFSLKFNNKPVKVVHNAGTSNLQKAFAAFMSGNISTGSQYMPTYIDIRDAANTTSYLYEPAKISGSRYEYESSGGAWMALHNASIAYDNVKTRPSSGVLCTVVLIGANNTDLATFQLYSDESINLITENVTGLITWAMSVLL